MDSLWSIGPLPVADLNWSAFRHHKWVLLALEIDMWHLEYELLWVWLLFFSIVFLRIIHISRCISCLFSLLLCNILLYGYSTVCLYIHCLARMWVVLNFYLLWIKLPWTYYGGFSGGTMVKNVPANIGDARDTGSIPELGWSGEGNGKPLQCFCLENSLDWWATVHGVAKSRTWSSDYAHMHQHIYTYLCVDIFLPLGYILGVELSHYMVIFSLLLMMLNVFYVLIGHLYIFFSDVSV